MSHSYNRVNYGVSQLLTNVIKHKGITTTLAKCVTRCKHHFCSLCPFFDLHWYPPSMSQPIQHGQLWCLTTFDQCHQAYGNNYYFGKVCDQMQTLHLQSVAFFALHFYHPPTPPSSLFYSTEINSLLPETGFRCFLQSTVLPSIKGGNYGLFLVTHSHWEQGQNLFPHTQVMKT